MPPEKPAPADGTRTVHTVCSHDCPDSCGVLVTVDASGRAIKVQGDPDHPVTQGFLCGKVAKYLERVYSPERLLYPMKRRAGVPKGPLPQGREAEAFERISWDEALDLVASRFQSISEEYGPESILPYSYAGTIGVLGYGSMDRRFFHRLGASQLDRTICATAGGDALMSVYGRKIGTDTEDFRFARYIIAWAANVHGNNIHLWPLIEEARRNGAKLVVIDPYRTRTAQAADWHIAIRPGTDSALALGIMHVLFRDSLYDRDYVAQYGHGFEQLWERAIGYSPAYVAEWTGIPTEDIERLAREYATTEPAVIRLNYGIQRSENGGAAARAVMMLPALIGAWKYRGGGLQLSTSGAFPWDKKTIERPDLMIASPLGRPARVVNMTRLGHALTEMESPRVRAMFVYNSNPAAIAPDQAQVLRGLARTDLFTVVHEQFFTDTADYADVVLPATTFLEHNDVQGAYGHYYVGLSNQAIQPLGEARQNVWVFSELARRMGFAESCFADTPDDLIAQALWRGKPKPSELAGINTKSLNAEGHIRLKFQEEAKGGHFLPFADGGFGTPSGKVEFYSEALEAQGLDPLPGYVPATESRFGAVDAYPLEFLPRKADNYTNSTFANLPGHQKMENGRMGTLEIHSTDAAARAISEGDRVEVFNARGRIELTARVMETVPQGVVAARLSWNKLSDGGNNVNLLTSQRLTDLGGGPTFYSTLVEVRKILQSGGDRS
jgi:molybdopterin guanine dinucleotide-containing S/N-oxide reductase-like protein